MRHAFLTGLILLISAYAMGQKYAIVDSKYILENVPEYHEAQKDIDQLSAQWQREIEERHETIDKLKKALQAERVLLTDDMITTREEEIAQKEKEARELQRKRFGVGGDMFKRRQEYIQPIQDMIYEAISEVASRSGYMAIFDKGMNSNILYVDSKFDLSDRILRRMGIRPGEANRGGGDDSDDDDDRNGGGSDRESGRSATPDRGAATPDRGGKQPAQGGSSPRRRP